MRARFIAVVLVGLTVTVACTSSGGDALTTGNGIDSEIAASTQVNSVGTAVAPASTSSTSTDAETTAPSGLGSVTSEAQASSTEIAPGPATTTTTTTATAAESSVPAGPPEQVQVQIRFESQVSDVSDDLLQSTALAILNDKRGWVRAGFVFVAALDAQYRVVLAEGAAVDQLCLPLDTGDYASCQNGPVVALNADRWRGAVEHWDGHLDGYRTYLVNHEVGHLIGMRHPTPRCPVPGAPAAVMEQQTGSLRGCVGNGWPRDWEIDHAKIRPVVFAPLPDWAPEPIPANLEAG